MGDLLLVQVVAVSKFNDPLSSTDFVEILNESDRGISLYSGYCFHDGSTSYLVSTTNLCEKISGVISVCRNINTTTAFTYCSNDNMKIEPIFKVGPAAPTTIPALGICLFTSNSLGSQIQLPTGWTNEFLINTPINQFTFGLYSRDLTSTSPIPSTNGEISVHGYRTVTTLALEPQSNQPGIKVNNITTDDRHKVNDILQSLINKINNK
jgi:hypothetical protein